MCSCCVVGVGNDFDTSCVFLCISVVYHDRRFLCFLFAAIFCGARLTTSCSVNNFYEQVLVSPICRPHVLCFASTIISHVHVLFGFFSAIGRGFCEWM